MPLRATTHPRRAAAAEPRSALDTPRRFDSHRVVERIGRGAMGITYLAVCDAPGESSLVACIKAPHPMFANDPRFVEAFRNEARFASRLHHPNIVELRHIGRTQDGRRYLVYPFVEGLDLGELIASVRDAREQLSWPLVATIAAQLAHALEYAHTDQRGSGRFEEHPPTIHRDICPANILVGVSGVASLTDFGIARALEEASLVPSLIGSGRIAYCAPERLRGSAYDARADLFSLGVVLFEALTNERPFATESGSIAAHIRRVFDGPRPRVEALRAEYMPSYDDEVPEELAHLIAIVHRLLEPDPDIRYSSAAELVDALERIVTPPGTHRELAWAAEERMPPWRRRVRLRTGETPASPLSLWSGTNPAHLTAYLKGAKFDAERDGIRVTAAGARRLLASASKEAADTSEVVRTQRVGDDSNTFADTAPLGGGFDATVPDRPIIEIEETEVLSPLPPDFPATNDQRPVFDLADSETPPAPIHERRPTEHAQVATNLPAYRVNTSGTLAPVTPSKPQQRNAPAATTSSGAILLIGGAILLSILGVCGIGAVVAITWISAALGASGGGHTYDFTGSGSDSEPLVSSATQPILADIDGDGISDLVATATTTERMLLAASGANAETLWTYPLPAGSIAEIEHTLTFAVPARQLVLHVDHRGTAVGIDGRTGLERWRVDLGEPMQRSQPLPCVSAETAYLRSPEDYWFAIDLDSGAHRQTGPPDGTCAPRRPLGFRAQLRQDDSTEWTPNSFRAHPSGDNTRWRRGWLLPEQPRLLVEGAAQEPTGRSVAVLAFFETHLNRRGQARPADTPLWQTFVAQRPAVTSTEGIRNLTPHGDHLFVVYDMVSSRADAPERVAAFDMRTGARLWDAALERNSGRVFFVHADEERVWIGHQAIEVLDRRTGQHLGRVGRWR